MSYKKKEGTNATDSVNTFLPHSLVIPEVHGEGISVVGEWWGPGFGRPR